MRIIKVVLDFIFSMIAWAVAALVAAPLWMLMWNRAVTHAFCMPELDYWDSWCLLMLLSVFIVRPAPRN